ncbi:MAG: hypothetical protein ABEH77_08940 [Halobacteriaceae archaeon]
MAQRARPAPSTEPEGARLDRLERVVEALADEVGVSWQPCTHCEEGVVLRSDGRMWCTDCEYSRHV